MWGEEIVRVDDDGVAYDLWPGPTGRASELDPAMDVCFAQYPGAGRVATVCRNGRPILSLGVIDKTEFSTVFTEAMDWFDAECSRVVETREPVLAGRLF